MLCDHILNLSQSHLLAKLLHCELNVFGCDTARVVRVKLLEKRFEFGIGQEELHIHSCRQELAIVDLLIVVVIKLTNDFLDLGVTHVQSLPDEDVFQLGRLDHARTIRVNGLELSLQFTHVIIIRSLNNQVHCCLFECAYSLKAPQAAHNLVTDYNVTRSSGTLLLHLEPRMVKSIRATQPLILVDD